MWDAIIVGARCAGSATALLLARQGHKVLLLDRASFPSDTLSTHFLWPRGCSYLNRWGVLDEVLVGAPGLSHVNFARDGIAFAARTPLKQVERRLHAVHGDGTGAVTTHVSVRRTVLDQWLVEKAIAAGVEFRPGAAVKRLVFDGDRVVGAAGDGFEERGRLVIGADGRNSFVAKAVQAPVYDERENATFAYWTYFSGLGLKEAVMEKRGRLCVVIVPTNFGAGMALVFGPKAWYPQFREHFQENYMRAIAFVNPGLEEKVRAGHQEERFYGVGDQRAFKRQCVGQGWLLVGDAACIKDQCTAIGMTHAFRDAELAAACIGNLEDYARRREADLADYYEFVDRMAGMALATPDDMRFMRGVQANPELADEFAAMYGDALRVDEYIAEGRPRVPLLGDDVPSPDGLACLL
ncbi:MAG: FAD-binding monooxygenase [Cyanobacteria bacterium RYN_339]|nr:FAD-binding monooxygenase [Cyanobacteria bacterium RYN_339]